MVFLGSLPTESTFENHDKSVSLHIGVTEVLSKHNMEEKGAATSSGGTVEEGQFNCWLIAMLQSFP